MPRATSLWGGTPFRSCPIKVTDPPRGWRRPEMVLSTVDFPAPLAPMRVTISPSLTSRDTPFTAWMLP